MRSASLALASALSLAASACTPPRPGAALDAYARALEAQDAAAVSAHSAARVREARPVAEVAERLAADPEGARARAEALRGLELHIYAAGEGPDGRPVRLVLEDGAWRVAAGGLDFVDVRSPEAALRTLIEAARHRRVADARATIPEAYSARYASDASLVAHLEKVRPRLEAVAEALGPNFEGRAEVHEDRARLPYGDGRSVRFVLEAGRWRVLDVE